MEPELCELVNFPTNWVKIWASNFSLECFWKYIFCADDLQQTSPQNLWTRKSYTYRIIYIYILCFIYQHQIYIYIYTSTPPPTPSFPPLVLEFPGFLCCSSSELCGFLLQLLANVWGHSQIGEWNHEFSTNLAPAWNVPSLTSPKHQDSHGKLHSYSPRLQFPEMC